MQWQYNKHLQPTYRMSYQSQSMLAILLPHPSGVCLHPFNAGKIKHLPDLLNELSTVTQWYLFGIYLGVDLTTLSEIEANYRKVRECLTHTVAQWWRNVTPTWSAVVNALMGIGREKLASQVAEKHGMDYIWNSQLRN